MTEGLGTGLLLVVGSIQEAFQGVSRERALYLGRKALASDLLQSEDRMYLTNAVAAVAMAGEVDEAQAGLERVIAAAERSGDRITAAGHRLTFAGCKRSGFSRRHFRATASNVS